MRILLTNDDGIYAPGLRALRMELRKLGEVLVVAPAAEQSAAGHSVTLTTPLIVQEVLDEERQLLGWAVEGNQYPDSETAPAAQIERLTAPDLTKNGAVDPVAHVLGEGRQALRPAEHRRPHPRRAL